MGCSICQASQILEIKKNHQEGVNGIKTEDEIRILHNSVVKSHNKSLEINYSIEKKIGSGTFGKVYKVLYKPLNQHRAMKVVKQDSVNFQDDENKFLKEIEMLSQLDHPNIIKIHEYYIDELNYYIITELARGGELYDQISTIKSFDEENSAMIIHQILSAVCYMHGLGIVHRDIKPENIMLENCGRDDMNRNDKSGDLSIKIIDFGTSNYYTSSEKLSLKVGSPYYIAPEVLYNSYDNKCDIWSIGVIMYVLLSGSPPFDGPDDHSILQKVSKGVFSMNSSEWSVRSQESKDLIQKMMTYNPNKRISACDALKHNWFKRFMRNKQRNNSNNEKCNVSKAISFDNLRKFNVKQKIQQATIAFLVHNVSTSKMVTNLKCIFKELDQDNNGTLSYDELKQGFNKYYGVNTISEMEFKKIMEAIDINKNNSIEYEEFLSATINLKMLLSDKNLQLAFYSYDTDNTKMLSSN